MSREDYEVVMGLEVHAELSTKTKIFCSCPTSFGAAPNTHVCPICMAMLLLQPFAPAFPQSPLAIF